MSQAIQKKKSVGIETERECREPQTRSRYDRMEKSENEDLLPHLLRIL